MVLIRCVQSAALLLCGVWESVGWCQTAPERPVPRDYRGMEVQVDGIFVTPITGAPFTAKVQIVSHQRLVDGTEHVVMSSATVARSSSGRIYNERRQLLPQGYQGEPRLLSSHIYDPNTRISVFLNPATRLAREQVLQAQGPGSATSHRVPTTAGVVERDLGSQLLDGVELHGLRKSRTVPAAISGTGKEIVVEDDYWYSTRLALDMIIRHSDPRSGEQMVAVTEVKPTEPNAALFEVPATYKLVDETPPPQDSISQ